MGVQAGVTPPYPFPSLTWRSRWGSGRSHRALRGRRRTPPAALPAGSARPWRPRAAALCPSPAGTGSLNPAVCPWDGALGPPPPPNTAPSPGTPIPTGAHRVEEVGLGAQREQAQAGLQVARPHARVQLLRRRDPVKRGICPHRQEGGSPHPHPTLLRSLAVTPSSSRQGSLWTKANIWYLARMNSDLVGLGGGEEQVVERGGEGHPVGADPPSPRHLLHFILGVCLPAPALHLRRIQQRVLPDGVGPVARQGVHHLRGKGRARWARSWEGVPVCPPPCPCGAGTHLEQGGGPGAVAQVLDDGDVAAQAAVHAAALVADEHPAVDGGPAGVCGVAQGVSPGVPAAVVPSPSTPLLLGGGRGGGRDDALPQQPFPWRWRGAQPITRGNPQVSHSNQSKWGGGAGFGLPHQEGSRWQGRCQPHGSAAQAGGYPDPPQHPVRPHPPPPPEPPGWVFWGGGSCTGATCPLMGGHPQPVGSRIWWSLALQPRHPTPGQPRKAPQLSGQVPWPPIPTAIPPPSPSLAGLEPFVSPLGTKGRLSGRAGTVPGTRGGPAHGRAAALHASTPKLGPGAGLQ